MRVSEYVGEWVNASLSEQLGETEEVWYDVTMAPTGGGPNADAPFLAVLLAMKSPMGDQTFNISHFFVDFVALDEPGVGLFITEALMQLRTARSKAIAAVQLKENGSTPGRLYLPGDAK